jgi:protein-S-isoprenylcysteine O-methyltransferase Ste14
MPSLGPRGEGWVAIQAVLLLAAASAGWFGSRWPEGTLIWRVALAAFLAIAGVALMVGGFRRLGSQLTPYPRPVAEGELKQHGVYGLVRHPIYGGAVLFCLAWSLVSSPWALVPTALLALLFEGKRRREEAWLADHDPRYEDYVRRVRRRFIPYLW